MVEAARTYFVIAIPKDDEAALDVVGRWKSEDERKAFAALEFAYNEFREVANGEGA